MVSPRLGHLWTLVWFWCASQVWCFNFDTRLPIIKRGAHGTYFGFSVAQHIISQDNPSPKIENSVLLVGAPLDQNAQPQTNRSGALWRCPLTTLNYDCQQVITDGKRDADGDYELTNIDNNHLRPPQKDEIKDGQWLGVTVRTQGQGGKVLVCAHRYIRTVSECTLDTCRWGRGLCYTLTNELDLDQVLEPCKGRPTERGHEQYGYCQAGTSGMLLNDDAIVGAPGPYTWRGTVYVQSVSDNFLDRDQTMYYSPHIDDQTPIDKYSYLGMAVTAADFFGNGIAYAAGAPRSDGTGQVILFNRKLAVTMMTTQMVLSGDMYTSNFGYELATADVNGDKLPDLIVGAPNYFDKNQGGAIYVYLNSKNPCSLKCSQPLKITGQPESRFGISITNLGDINKDGFEDIAVGAPYEGHGVIYIYLGSKNGTIPEPSQTIRGEDYNIETFGYSLSGGTDLDFNGYPDLLVGAFDSSAAILFRTRPIIWITTNVGPQSALKKIDPTSRGCSNKDLACFKFQACVSIQSILEGGKLKAGSGGLTLNCTLQADITRRLPRVFIENDSPQSKPSTVHSTITLEIDPDTLELKPYCHDHTVYIKEDTKDIQTAISMRLSYSIIQEPPKPIKAGAELPKMDHYPILNQQQADKVFQATFLKDCGENDICESQLNINADLDLPFAHTKDKKDTNRYDLVLGEYKEIQLNVTVHNLQESAYEAELHITHSPALSYIAAVKGRCERFPENNLVICPLGNPLQRNRGVNVSLRFEPLREADEVPDVNFTLKAKTTSHLVDPQDDVVLVANVIRKADLKLRGSVRPEEVLYGGQVRGESEMKYKDQPGTRLRHTYEVVNDGPWHVNNLELHVEWPFQVANNKPLGKWLLYMDDEPAIEAEEGGVCDTSEGQVNPLHLRDRHSQALPEFTSNTTGAGQVASSLRRARRDVEMIVKKGPDNIVHMNCRAKTAKCFKFRCIVYKLQKGQSATVTIKARLWNSTLVEDYPRVKAVHIASNAKLFTPTPNVIITSEPSDIEARAVTIAKGGGFAEQQASDGVELWMILLGVVAGLLLLLLIALLFWKCGFFKRTRPDPTLSGNLEKHTDDYHDY
uniref:Integrin alpha-PS1 n=1 Tax=Lygus hesperus TaxID=30085 RepID=A0A146L1L1_LYGHE